MLFPRAARHRGESLPPEALSPACSTFPLYPYPALSILITSLACCRVGDAFLATFLRGASRTNEPARPEAGTPLGNTAKSNSACLQL